MRASHPQTRTKSTVPGLPLGHSCSPLVLPDHEPAISLNNRPVPLGDLGPREDALTASEEAVTIHLAAARWPPPTATSWNSRCELLPGLSAAKTSATHSHGSRSSDNGPLSRLPVSYFVAADTDRAKGHHRAPKPSIPNFGTYSAQPAVVGRCLPVPAGQHATLPGIPWGGPARGESAGERWVFAGR